MNNQIGHYEGLKHPRSGLTGAKRINNAHRKFDERMTLVEKRLNNISVKSKRPTDVREVDQAVSAHQTKHAMISVLREPFQTSYRFKHDSEKDCRIVNRSHELKHSWFDKTSKWKIKNDAIELQAGLQAIRQFIHTLYQMAITSVYTHASSALASAYLERAPLAVHQE